MEISIGSFIGSLAAATTAGVAAWNAFANRSKLKLSLYEKRLEIFRDAHELYLILYSDKDYDIFNKKYFEFKIKYRAAKFLFDPKDSELLISQLKKFGEYSDMLQGHHDRKSNEAERKEALRLEMEKILTAIEKMIQPYLQAPRHHIWRYMITLIKEFYKNHFQKLTEKYTD
jgi:hypothetical protein